MSSFIADQIIVRPAAQSGQSELAADILGFSFPDDMSDDELDEAVRQRECMTENLLNSRGGLTLAKDKLRVAIDRFRTNGFDDPEYQSDARDFRLIVSALEDLDRLTM